MLSSGLFEAAVPTGSATMPAAEPGPEVGTWSQAGPKMSEIWVTPLAAELVAADDELELELGAADDDEPLAAVVVSEPVEASSELLQAAMVMVSAARAPTAESRWIFLTSVTS